jgi:ribosomal protein S18 acetylase RimI-like enzyme
VALRRAGKVREVGVRDMTAGDVPRVADIFRDAFNDIYKRRGFGPVVTDVSVGAVIADAYRDLDPGGCVVVTVGDEVAGSGFLHPRGVTGGAGPITIAPAHQGAGAGRALMDEICRRADAAGIASLRLIQDAFNEVAYALYCRTGFVGREVLLRASFRSTRGGAFAPGVRRAYRGDLARVGEIERALLGIDRPRDHALLMRLGELFLAENGYLARIVRGGVTVLGPLVAESLDTTLALIEAGTSDLATNSDVRLLVPSCRDDLVSALFARHRLDVHSLCTYMVRGSYQGLGCYYVPTLFPESG